MRPMRFTVEHPVGQPGCAPDLVGPDGLARFARAVEDAGFDALAFTEHPAPSKKWLDAGGHATLDPLAALAFCACATTRLRLMTYALVLPYRNPLLVAKSIATVDALSGGRLIVGAAGGYLRSEFAALGVSFEDRGSMFDEALEVITALWTGPTFTARGRQFDARAQVSVPAPVQLPHPPIWLAGNGHNVRRRVARLAQGWSPLLIDGSAARTTRSRALPDARALAGAIRELRDLLAEAGRDADTVDVQVQSVHGSFPVTGGSVEQHRHHIGELAEAGATQFVVQMPGSSNAAAIDAVTAYADNVIAVL